MSVSNTYFSCFLADGIVDVLLFEVRHLCINLGILDAGVRGNGWHLRVGEGLRCLIHDGFLEAINKSLSKVKLQFLHIPGENFQGYWFKI